LYCLTWVNRRLDPISIKGFLLPRLQGYPVEALPESQEKVRNISAQRPSAVSSLLDDDRGQAQGPDAAAVFVKILCQEVPCPRGVTPGGVQTEGDDEETRPEPGYLLQGLVKRLFVDRPAHLFGEGVVDVVALSRPLPFLVGEPAEVGVGETGVAVYRYRQNVGPLVEDLLRPVSVVIVDIEDRQPSVGAEKVRRHGGGIEVAEAPEGAPLRVVSRRAYQGIGETVALQDRLGRRQRAVNGALGCQVGVLVQRREGVDTVVPRPNGHLLGGVRLVADREYVGVDRFSRLEKRTHPFEVFHIMGVVNGLDVLFGKVAGPHPLEEVEIPDSLQDPLDPHRGLDVPPLMDMMDIVFVVDHQGDPLLDRPCGMNGSRGVGPGVSRRTDPCRIIGDRGNHHIDITVWAGSAVLSCEDGPYDHPEEGRGEGCVPPQRIENQVGGTVAPRPEGSLVGGIDDRVGPVLLIEPQPLGALGQFRLSLAQAGIVGEALEEEPYLA